MVESQYFLSVQDNGQPVAVDTPKGKVLVKLINWPNNSVASLNGAV